jgi:hypothetical protein
MLCTRKDKGCGAREEGYLTVSGGGGRKECSDGFDSAKGEAAADWNVQSLDHLETLKYSLYVSSASPQICHTRMTVKKNDSEEKWAITTSLYPPPSQTETMSVSYSGPCEREDFSDQEP